MPSYVGIRASRMSTHTNAPAYSNRSFRLVLRSDWHRAIDGVEPSCHPISPLPDVEGGVRRPACPGPPMVDNPRPKKKTGPTGRPRSTSRVRSRHRTRTSNSNVFGGRDFRALDAERRAGRLQLFIGIGSPVAALALPNLRVGLLYASISLAASLTSGSRRLHVEPLYP
jgi:hypothetical protein